MGSELPAVRLLATVVATASLAAAAVLLLPPGLSGDDADQRISSVVSDDAARAIELYKVTPWTPDGSPDLREDDLTVQAIELYKSTPWTPPAGASGE